MCCGEVTTGWCVSPYGGKSMCEWAGAGMIESISGASVGAAAKFFIHVYMREILVVSSNERSKQNVPRMCWFLCAVKWQRELE